MLKKKVPFLCIGEFDINEYLKMNNGIDVLLVTLEFPEVLQSLQLTL